jgi:hypothetical protein
MHAAVAAAIHLQNAAAIHLQNAAAIHMTIQAASLPSAALAKSRIRATV